MNSHLLPGLSLVLALFLSSCTTLTFDDYLHSARLKVEQGDFDGAISDLNKAIALNPNSAAAYGIRGYAKYHTKGGGLTYHEGGDLDGAIADFDKELSLEPNHLSGYLNRSAAKDDKGDFDGAIADCDKCIALSPDFPNAYYNRGNAKGDKGEFDEAIADYDKAIALDPAYASAYNNRGLAKERKGDIDGAIADYETAIALEPNAPRRYSNRGTARQSKGDFDGALADYEKAIALCTKKETDPDLIFYPYFRRYLVVRRLHPSSSTDKTAELAGIVAGWKNGWPKTVGLYLTGAISEADFLAKAGQGDAKTVHEQQCKAFYYVGMTRLLANEPAAARGFFEQCRAKKEITYDEYDLAKVELARLPSLH